MIYNINNIKFKQSNLKQIISEKAYEQYKN